MAFAIGACVLILSLLAWLGQIVSAVAPDRAVRWGLTEDESEVDPTFLADIRAECIWDSLTLWTLPVAAVLMILDEASWTFFGLIGGGMYLYFAGRGIAQRIIMTRRGILVGKPENVKTFYVFLALWGAVGLAVMVLACFDILGRM